VDVVFHEKMRKIEKNEKHFWDPYIVYDPEKDDLSYKGQLTQSNMMFCLFLTGFDIGNTPIGYLYLLFGKISSASERLKYSFIVYHFCCLKSSLFKAADWTNQ
jgi:hypothetical protein